MTRKRKPDDEGADESTEPTEPTELWVDTGKPPAEPPAKPHAKPAVEYVTLTSGGQPVVGELQAKHPAVFELKLAQEARYSIMASRLGLPGVVQVEVHAGAYPAPVPVKRPGVVIGPLQAGVYYVVVLPVDPEHAEGRFSLACRRVGRA